MPMARKQVTLEDVRAVMGDEAEARAEEAIDAAGSGDLPRLDLALERLWIAGTSPVAVVRSAMAHFQRVLLATVESKRGESHRRRDPQAAPAAAFLARRIVQDPGPALERSQARRRAGPAAGNRSAVQDHRRARRSGLRPRPVEHRRHGAEATLMLKVRVIPCLDVKDGRVVKGVNFVAPARCRRSGRAGDAL